MGMPTDISIQWIPICPQGGVSFYTTGRTDPELSARLPAPQQQQIE